jgi:hypothetical protein
LTNPFKVSDDLEEVAMLLVYPVVQLAILD